MIKVKYFLLGLIILILCFPTIGYKKLSHPINKIEATPAEMNYAHDNSDKIHLQKDILDIDQPEIAEYLSYDSSRETKFLYIAHLKIFQEFGTENEGFVLLYPGENILNFRITKATGTITGAVDGPFISFDLDLSRDTILRKESISAPHYGAYERPEFEEHSNKVIEITDERMIEIGNYFYELMARFEDIIQNPK